MATTIQGKTNVDDHAADEAIRREGSRRRETGPNAKGDLELFDQISARDSR